MATHCSILAWAIPWTEEPGGLRSELDTTERLNTRTHTSPQAHLLLKPRTDTGFL